MILQKILFPNPNICSEQELYYRGNLNTDNSNIQFNTYFNAFSIEKWKKYTNLKNLMIILNCSGIGTINIVNSFLVNNHVESNIIEIVQCSEKKKSKIEIPIKITDLHGVISLEIHTEKEFKFYDGCFFSNVEEKSLNPVKLGICICTFKREEYVNKNINNIKSNILCNKQSILKDNLEIFLVDNGKTLNNVNWGNKNIHYFENKNVGGAGGFARGMIESTFNYKNITHCILMDDDVVFEPSILEKTYAFLRLMKKNYQNKMIGGAMLYQEQMWCQFTSGEKWTNKKINVYRYNTDKDLRKLKNVLTNELENDINFNGWYYCCIPTKLIIDDNLPLPIFVHNDDMEYGVRNQKYGIILLNGISVWHPNLVGKGSKTNIYYNNRNSLILKATHGKISKFYAKFCLLAEIIIYVIQYKYVEAEFCIKAYKDFYSGIDYFKTIDGEDLHRQLLSSNYTMYKSNLDINNEMKNISFLTFIARIITGALSYICPKFLEEKVYTSNVQVVSSMFAKKIVIYDINNNKAYDLKRDYRKMKKCFKEYIKIYKMINKYNKKMNYEWKERAREITNLDFWKRYLDIK